jgi:hypothetical protein
MIKTPPSFSFIEGISSDYHEWFDILDQEVAMIKSVVEIGTFNGGSTRFLEQAFTAATIYTFERPDHFEGQYIDLKEIRSGLSDRVVLIPQKSPPESFPDQVDICVFDIGHGADNLRSNLYFWLKQLSPQGTLIMLLPWSTPKKRQVRDSILQELRDSQVSLATKVNWVLIRAEDLPRAFFEKTE